MRQWFIQIGSAMFMGLLAIIITGASQIGLTYIKYWFYPLVFSTTTLATLWFIRKEL
jgi:hypothetical protein